MRLQKSSGQLWSQPPMEEGGNRRTHVQTCATLATRQQNSAGRPGVVGVLSAERAEEMVEQFEHGYSF
jgi:hypothetical protein